jgi:hypothetical protein
MKCLCVTVFTRLALLDQEGPEFVLLRSLFNGVGFGVVRTDYLFVLYDDDLAAILLYQLVLVFQEVLKFAFEGFCHSCFHSGLNIAGGRVPATCNRSSVPAWMSILEFGERSLKFRVLFPAHVVRRHFDDSF